MKARKVHYCIVLTLVATVVDSEMNREKGFVQLFQESARSGRAIACVRRYGGCVVSERATALYRVSVIASIVSEDRGEVVKPVKGRERKSERSERSSPQSIRSPAARSASVFEIVDATRGPLITIRALYATQQQTCRVLLYLVATLKRTYRAFSSSNTGHPSVDSNETTSSPGRSDVLFAHATNCQALHSTRGIQVCQTLPVSASPAPPATSRVDSPASDPLSVTTPSPHCGSESRAPRTQRRTEGNQSGEVFDDGEERGGLPGRRSQTRAEPLIGSSGTFAPKSVGSQREA